MTSKHPKLLSAQNACLIVVDLQERFESVIKDFDSVVAGTTVLIKLFRILELPIIITEQYPEGLGETISSVSAALVPRLKKYKKTCFSCCDSDEVSKELLSLRATEVLICGVETHVCISQTAHGLRQRGLSVHVVVDAVGSRKSIDQDYALRRMEQAGVVLTTAETAAFELLEDSRHPKFKEAQALFK